jgi:LmbE family N-acetylglucosaminyl deacetylase
MTPSRDEKELAKRVDSFKKRILVVEPHPDDGAIQSGGTIARMVMEGHEAYFLTVTDGERGTMDRNIRTEQQLREMTRKEALDATGVLGVKKQIFLGYPNHDTMPHLEKELRMKITEVVRQVRPHIVMTYDPYSLYEPNPDHRTVSWATYDAVSFSHYHLEYPDQLARGLETHIVDELWLWNSPHPDHTVDITATIWTKVKATTCYKTQIASMLEEIRRRLRSAGFTAPMLQQMPFEELTMRVFSPMVENGRYVEKFKIIRPFVSERVPHLLAQGLVEPLKE